MCISFSIFVYLFPYSMCLFSSTINDLLEFMWIEHFKIWWPVKQLPTNFSWKCLIGKTLYDQSKLSLVTLKSLSPPQMKYRSTWAYVWPWSFYEGTFCWDSRGKGQLKQKVGFLCFNLIYCNLFSPQVVQKSTTLLSVTSSN